MRKLFLAIPMVVVLMAGLLSIAGAANAAARPGATVLTGSFKCTKGAVTARFKPALKLGATGSSTIKVVGSAHKCVESAGQPQSTSTGISGFTGTISTNCATLVGSDAPAISGGVFSWNPTTMFVASSGIALPAGAAMEPDKDGQLQVSWTNGTIGAGSFAGTTNLYLKVVTKDTETQLAQQCESSKGISSIVLTGKGG